MAEFIWIASYPKSGCTWLRFIIAHLLFGEEEGDLNVSRIVPDMHDYTGPLNHTWQGSYLAKTHLCVENLPPRMHTRSAVHIIRNPLDVIDSAIAYLKPDTIAQRDDMLSAYCEYGGIEPWKTTNGYGTWQGNAKSWRETKHGFPTILFRYEDMLEDTHSHVRQLAEFFGVDISDERVDEIVQLTSFSSMKKREEEEVTTKASGVFNDEQIVEKPVFRFMRSGKSGGYKESFSEDEISRLTEFFRPTMEAHGYL